MLKKINFNEFEKVTKQEWLSQIEKDLKGKPLSILEKEIENGLHINSINSHEDTFVAKDLGRDSGVWNYAQTFTEGAKNEDILENLGRGVNEIFIPFSKEIYNQFKGVNQEFITSNILVNSFDEVKDLKIQNGAFVNDIINKSIETGENITDETLSNWKEGFLKASKKSPNLKTLCLDNLHLQESGANATLQVASIFSAFAEYLNLLQEEEIEPALNSAFVRIGLSKNYFLEIAKIRAIQFLWENFCKAYTDNPINKLYIFAQTSTSDLTRFDDKTNLLRLSTQAMSGILGGAQAVSILPFDTLNQTNSNLAERASINMHHLFKEEANLHRVSDPAKGSYFVENLTQELANSSWSKFLEIEHEGGFIHGLKDGWIQHEVLGTATEKVSNVNSGKSTIIGVNKFENNLVQNPKVNPNQEEDSFTPIVKLPKVNYASSVEQEKSEQ